MTGMLQQELKGMEINMSTKISVSSSEGVTSTAVRESSQTSKSAFSSLVSSSPGFLCSSSTSFWRFSSDNRNLTPLRMSSSQLKTKDDFEN
ncbi:hypothetical protein E2C01_022440 [Portunus trituberculatus]|uniref:Uncharacterized protein n=1 Tax=Portunus trituberculatus TaxID=210409 RepID=A0A5B7E724_PORTR|nr:hypothetical protein [Portunus trituberculatus]